MQGYHIVGKLGEVWQEQVSDHECISKELWMVLDSPFSTHDSPITPKLLACYAV